ncbi:15445_t:CDS:2, partial [Funneliformis geosporum]
LSNSEIGNLAIRKIARSYHNLKFLSLESCKDISRNVLEKLDQNIKIEWPDSDSDNKNCLVSHLVASITQQVHSATYPFKSQIKIVPEKLVEGQKDDFKQGFAQATVQMESSFSRKRKANEIDDEKPVFKLSKPLFVTYEDEGMKDMAEKVLGHILWLLEETQKLIKALEESREIKRVRSGDLAGKKN